MHGLGSADGNPTQVIDPDATGRVQKSNRVRAVGAVLAANLSLLVAEVVAAIAFGSLALLADAAHMVSDVVGLGLAFAALSFITRPASARHSYGLLRAEVLAGQAIGLLLIGSAVWIVMEVAERIGNPPPVIGGWVLAVATLGLVVNVGSMVVLARVSGESLGVRAAFVHMRADAAGSVGVLVSAGFASAGYPGADPIVAAMLALMLLWTGGRILLETTHILMEGTPKNIDPSEVESAIQAVGNVADVHDLHVWHLSSEVLALSAHIVTCEGADLPEAQALADSIREVVAGLFGITHTTLEMEATPCLNTPQEV